jgi:hypothetical protein
MYTIDGQAITTFNQLVKVMNYKPKNQTLPDISSLALNQHSGFTSRRSSYMSAYNTPVK